MGQVKFSFSTFKLRTRDEWKKSIEPISDDATLWSRNGKPNAAFGRERLRLLFINLVLKDTIRGLSKNYDVIHPYTTRWKTEQQRIP